MDDREPEQGAEGSGMTRETFERELGRLNDETLALGSMVQQAINEAVDALMARDLEASRRLVAGDQTINEKRFSIEADTLATIATQQPMASDLRRLAAILEIITELLLEVRRDGVGIDRLVPDDRTYALFRIDRRDGAAAHLDPELAIQIQQAITNLMNGRTTLLIAHQLQSVYQADRIIVLDDGRLVETGTHQSLLQQHGFYHHLVIANKSAS